MADEPVTRSLSSLVVIAPLLAACSSGPRAQPGPPPTTGPTPPAATRAPGTLSTDPFGGERFGFAEASSHNGRTVFLRRFSGAERPTFGQHGESGTDTQLTLFDRFRGSEVEVDDLIDVDPSRRWFLLLNGGELWLVDGVNGRWDELKNADMEADTNGCLPPRQAVFSAAGKLVAWVGAGSAAVTVRDLASSEEWAIKSDRRIWRAWPVDDARAAVLATVAADSEGWPGQRTSCVCRWCLRFAASYGNYGWGGPDFTLEKVDDKGRKSPSSGPPEGEREWHGKTASGCTLEPASSESSLDRGPWHWSCPAPP